MIEQVYKSEQKGLTETDRGVFPRSTFLIDIV